MLANIESRESFSVNDFLSNPDNFLVAFVWSPGRLMLQVQETDFILSNVIFLRKRKLLTKQC